MNKKKIKSFIKKHTKEIAISAVALTGIIGYAIVKERKNDHYTIMDLPIPEEGVGEFWELFKDVKHDETVAAIHEITVGDLGEVGKRLCDVEDITGTTKACVLVEMQN